MKSKRLIVISLDALGSTDFETFSQLPNFKKFIDHAAFCRQVRSVYPSLTYPAHTTIVTGRPPAPTQQAKAPAVILFYSLSYHYTLFP